MEATNKIQIVRIEIVRDFDKSYYANLYNENGVCHNLSKEYTDFRTLKTLCKKEYGVNLPNLSQIGFETHGRKSYAYISTETPRISAETAETVNVSAEGEKEAERPQYRVSRFGGYKIIVGDRVQGKVVAVLMSVNGHNIIEVNDETAHISTMGEKPLQIDRPIMQLSDAEVLELIYKPTQPQDEPRETENKPTVADVAQMVKTELAKNKAMRTAWHLEFPDGTMCDIRHKSTAAGCDFYEYTEVREGEETFKDYKATERDITLYICQLLDLDAPQSPETSRKVA